jgi:hypothetical protein
MLAARSSSCFSSHYLLQLNGRPHGEFSGRWFSEGIDIRLTNRRRLHLDKISWAGSHFRLIDGRDETVLCEASRGGFLTTAWDLTLSAGPARLVSAGIFNTGFRVLAGAKQIAEVDRTSMCDGGWVVQDSGIVREEDLLFIGLLFHTILRRRSDAAAGAAS